MRYFVRFNAGEDRVADDLGKDFSDLASARAEAVQAAREIISFKLHQNEAVSPAWSFEIVDPSGRIVETLLLERILFGASLPDRQRYPRGDQRRFGFGTAELLSPRLPLVSGLARAALIILSLGATYLAIDYARLRYWDDYPASTATTGRVSIGGSIVGNIDRPGDADWFKVELAADKSYSFHLEGSHTGQGTLKYPVLRLLDDKGQELHIDAGSIKGDQPVWTSTVKYMPRYSGTYHVSCEAPGEHTGTYKLSVQQT